MLHNMQRKSTLMLTFCRCLYIRICALVLDDYTGQFFLKSLFYLSFVLFLLIFPHYFLILARSTWRKAVSPYRSIKYLDSDTEKIRKPSLGSTSPLAVSASFAPLLDLHKSSRAQIMTGRCKNTTLFAHHQWHRDTVSHQYHEIDNKTLLNADMWHCQYTQYTL